MKMDFTPLLLGKDLRSTGRVAEVVRMVESQEDFDELFRLLLHHERLLVMRAADAIEKITMQRSQWLTPHKNQLFSLLRSSVNKELKWHLALLIVRVPLEESEVKDVWSILSYWARNPNESKIVRVNAIQGLYDLSLTNGRLREEFLHVLQELAHESIPSLQARVKKLKNQAAKTFRVNSKTTAQ